MNLIQPTINNKDGQFLIRKNSIKDLPKGIKTINDKMSTIDIMTVLPGGNFKEEIVVYVDYNDWEKVFKMNEFSFKNQLRIFLETINWPNDMWVRVDISILDKK
jgi:hypothetical protein